MFLPSLQDLSKDLSQAAGFCSHPPLVGSKMLPGSGWAAPTIFQPGEDEQLLRTVHTAKNPPTTPAASPCNRALTKTRYAGVRMEDLEKEGVLRPKVGVLSTSSNDIDTDTHSSRHDESRFSNLEDTSLPDFNVRGVTPKCVPSKFCCPDPGLVYCTTSQKPHSWTGSAYGPAPVFTLNPKDLNPLDN